jgi:hypothetical protein
MERGKRRTSGQIREEIRGERVRLETTVAELGAEAKRSGRLAGKAAGAFVAVLLLRRLRGRRSRT